MNPGEMANEIDFEEDFVSALMNSGLLYLVKILELLCGLALLSGYFVPLALLVLAPIIVNIAFFHFALDSAGVPIGLFLMGLWVGSALKHRERFLPLLTP